MTNGFVGFFPGHLLKWVGVNLYYGNKQKKTTYDLRKTYSFRFKKGISNLNYQDYISSLCPEGKNILGSVLKLAPTHSILVNFQKHICYSKFSSFNARKFLLLEIVLLAHSQHINISIPANPKEARVANTLLKSKGSILIYKSQLFLSERSYLLNLRV